MKEATDETGSMPVVLLVAIILAGVIVALYTTVSTGTDTAKRDRDWQSAVQVADAGIQQAFVNLRQLEEGETVVACDATGVGSCTGDIGDGEFEWEYEQASGSTTQWEVRSRGNVGNSARLLRANIGPRQVFPVAMLAKTSLTYNGGGGGNPPFSIGSFGSITLNGVPANGSVASIVAYGPGPHNISAGSQEITQAPTWSTDDLNNIAEEAFKDPDRCQEGNGRAYYDVYPADVIAAGQTPGVRGEIYCVGRVNFSSGSHFLSGTSTDPVEVYVKSVGSESFRVRTGAAVHWDASGPGDADEHLFFVQSGPVLFSANLEFSGGVYAPESSCSATGNQDLAGSVVCNDITLGGTFGYAEGLLDVTEGPFAINNFWEEPAGS